MPIGLLIGLGAGLVSAVLFASAGTGTVTGLLALIFLTPLPVAIVGLGWGWAAAAVAATGAFATITATINPQAALLHLLALGLPTVILSYLALLNRPVGGTPEYPQLEWYPLGRIVAFAAFWAGGLATLALLTTATDLDSLRATLRESFERMFVNQAALPSGEQPLGEPEIAALTELMVVSFAGAIATMWMLLAMLNLWLAGLITRASGRLTRPWPDIASLQMPRTVTLAFGIAVAASFIPGYPGLIASGFASAFVFAFMLVGLAIIHSVTRGMGARGFILGAVYGALLVLNPFSGLAIATIGLAEPVSPLRRKPPSNPPSIT